MVLSKSAKLALCSAVLTVSFASSSVSSAHAAGDSVEVWLSKPDWSAALAKQGNAAFGGDTGSAAYTIDVNQDLTYQQMDGFGASMTDSSAWLLQNKLTAAKRAEVMEKLFGSTGIGLSLLRQTVGASDFNWEAYSYADTAGDWNLNSFSIARDLPYIVPMVKQALAKNPGIKVIASPWSAPAWMKSSGSMNGGYLKPEAYGTYANYLTKFVQAYQGQGIPIYALTPQNEPLYTTGAYPTMSMSTADQIGFIRDYLGPSLRGAGLNTKIIAYDHNFDNWSYPDTVLKDAGAAGYIAGSAFHHYGGDPSAMTTLHNLHPSKDIWFTEGGFGSWNDTFGNIMHELITIPRNWSKAFIAWNIALDQNNGPSLLANSINYGMIKIRSDAMDQVSYNQHYYLMGHFSKFVVPGAYRIDTPSYDGSLENVAFKNPDGSKVVVAYNRTSASQNVKIKWGKQAFTSSIPAGAVVTFKWNGTPTRDLVAIKASANGFYVAAENGGSSPLIARSSAVSGWEMFEKVDLGGGNIALKSLANGRYVTAENAGAGALIARSTSVGGWETFQMSNVSGGVSLKAAANGKFVSADNAGSSPLIANKTSAGTWETFQFTAR
ncbi:MULTISPECIES: glycoside hydrolase family 30 beta sandwich domain-containing protein [Paenibacillus]|uniref:glycoside hydrolase family 30 beta sandwich domain-containing protein n=1 Tax=Paenibacillus TaxID=44249 RepID=UPI0022B8BDD5|nr:glycoside hydrolase family 30 beta sandwich domain-containing protein [Paenibacillus caseinilyticus]MCZ8522468.1 glucan endo-1,6-beta-glucosidase [Paenibacillus caseinilyticus]